MSGATRFEGRYYDGRVAVGHDVTVAFDTDALAIAASGDDGATIDRWPYAELVALPGTVRANEIMLGCRPRGDASLTVRDARFIEALERHAPGLARARRPKSAPLRRALGYAALTAAAGALIYFSLPHLARWTVVLVPPGLERDFGERYARSMSNRAKPCALPAGVRSLERLTARLARHAGATHPIEVEVLEIDTVNAITLPGGRIFVFSGLIAEAETGDELAGVLAHEIGHVVGRHSLVRLLESFAVETTLGTIFGTAVGGDAAAALVGLSYSRGMEVEADGFAAGLLTRAGIRRDGLASFFARLGSRAGGGAPLAILSSHPPSTERAQELQPGGGGPAMSDADWAAIRRICDDV